tara:strand:+ start:26 stop:178 length:153 start_codon:yes stop_codon:yes gene_type:complete
MGDFDNDNEEDESDDEEVLEFNPPSDSESTWHTCDQFERWIIIEGVSKAP